MVKVPWVLFRGSLQAAWAFYRDSPKDTMDILQKLSSSYHGHGAEGSVQRGSHVEDGHWHALKDSDSIESCDLQNANWVCTHSPLPTRHLSQLASQSVGITVFRCSFLFIWRCNTRKQASRRDCLRASQIRFTISERSRLLLYLSLMCKLLLYLIVT